MGSRRRSCTRRRASRTAPSARRSRGFRRLALRDELVDLFTHGAHDVRLGHLTDDLTTLEDETDPAAAGDADVRCARLAGPVDLTSHHGDVDLFVQTAELVFHFLREPDEIDVGASARGARHEGEPALAERERL